MGSTPTVSTSGKLPLPIIGGVRRYAKLHTTMVWFGFEPECTTSPEGRAAKYRSSDKTGSLFYNGELGFGVHASTNMKTVPEIQQNC